ncbi:MAG: ABC transporter ATP-binding protein [candidate division Zixibacteria bacterium]|nr:ABC transporter ATP-binding protein [candidate division Zixibacteria bacterium]
MRIVETKDLTKIFTTRQKKGNIIALDSVSLGVDQGEVFGLLGPNGAGKTTLVKTLMGLTSITSGDALVNGLPPGNPGSRQQVGFLPENPRFPSHLTGRALLVFSGRLSGVSDDDINSRLKPLLVLVGMERWADTKVSKYSKGMTQRIGVAQALIGDPDIVFLDEPTDGIDPIGKLEIRGVLEKIRDQGKTVFLNSHLLSEVEAIADRVAILSRGKLVRVGTVDELTVHENQYEIEADIGNERIVIPEEIGQRVSITAKSMTVSLVKPENINKVIDELRLRRINIWSVKPVKQSLEQSFFEAVTEGPEQTA